VYIEKIRDDTVSIDHEEYSIKSRG
jgi:hypothetical protein